MSNLKDVVREWIAGSNLPACTPQVLDQGLHVLWGFGISYLAIRAGMNRVVWAILLPPLAMLPRELIDQWPINNYFDTNLDLFFFAVGGFIAASLGGKDVR